MLYHYQIKGLISQAILPGSDGTLGTADDQLQYQNAGSIKANGLELTLEGKWPSGVEGRLSYALQKAMDDSTDKRLSNSPAEPGKIEFDRPSYLGQDSWGDSNRAISVGVIPFLATRRRKFFSPTSVSSVRSS